jgi:hypothetical protein
MLAMMDAQHAAHIYGDSASRYDNKVGIVTGEGFHTTSDLSGINEPSDGNEDNHPQSGLEVVFGEDDHGALGEFLGTMVRQQQVVVDDRWVI